MDALSMTLVVSAITTLVTGAAGEAGKQAWTGLTEIVRKAFGGDSEEKAALDLLLATPENEQAVREVSGTIVDRARKDPVFASDLEAWLGEVREETRLDGPTNVIAGEATVHGPVFQGRDFSGPITFGAEPGGKNQQG